MCCSVVSDDQDLGSVSGGVTSPSSVHHMSSRHVSRDSSGHVSRSQAQLTYLLHMLLEAECLDWACVLATVLQASTETFFNHNHVKLVV